MKDIKRPLSLDKAQEVTNQIIKELNNCKDSYMINGFTAKGCSYNLRDHLNNLIESDNLYCTELLITNNTDKQMFGIYILPNMSDWQIARIINDEYGEENKINEFRMEIDTGLFKMNYSSREILAMMLCDIYGTMGLNMVDKIRFAIEACVCNTGRAAAGYIPKLITKKHEYGIFRYVFTSFLRNLYTFAGDNQVIMPFGSEKHIHIIQALNMMPIIEDIYKDHVVALHGGSNPGSEINMIRWVFDLIDDLDMHLSDAIDTLATIKSTTGSKLEYNLLTAAIEGLKSGVDMSPTDKYVKESTILEGFSLFKSLKTNGLRGIEDDLYEYKIRIKNCEDEEEAMYILRQINTRLTILDDYVRNEDKLSENERQRWLNDIEDYKNLRYQLGQKKIGSKKQYGIFIDYDKLDQL